MVKSTPLRSFLPSPCVCVRLWQVFGERKHTTNMRNDSYCIWRILVCNAAGGFVGVRVPPCCRAGVKPTITYHSAAASALRLEVTFAGPGRASVESRCFCVVSKTCRFLRRRAAGMKCCEKGGGDAKKNYGVGQMLADVCTCVCVEW